MTIYNIVGDIYALKNLVNDAMTDEETGEVREFTDEEKADFLAWLDENRANLEEKFNSIYKVYCNIKAEADVAETERKMLKDEMERLSKRAKARENEAARVKGLFAYAMKRLNMKKYKTPLFSIGWQETRKTAKPLTIFNPDHIPVEYLKRELSASAINEAIKEGRLYEKEGFEHNSKLFYRDENGEHELKGVAYSGGETLVVR